MLLLVMCWLSSTKGIATAICASVACRRTESPNSICRASSFSSSFNVDGKRASDCLLRRGDGEFAMEHKKELVLWFRLPCQAGEGDTEHDEQLQQHPRRGRIWWVG